VSPHVCFRIAWTLFLTSAAFIQVFDGAFGFVGVFATSYLAGRSFTKLVDALCGGEG
jgi:hypothetical protein